MNKDQIRYERDINASYMKVPAPMEEGLDEKIILKRRLKGVIPVERCYINGEGQYWYNISGKQALDTYVKMHSLEYSVFELVLLRICEQLELLEWNLVDGNTLLVDPQFIFLNHRREDISFVLYPETNRDIFVELQKLMEFLLSKLNHADTEVVQGAYEFYEMVSSGEYQIQDLKESILKRRFLKSEKDEIKVEINGGMVAEQQAVYGMEAPQTEVAREGLQSQIEEKLSELYSRAKKILVRSPKEEMPTIVYPDAEEVVEKESHPTVCIAMAASEPRGILLYEGMGDYPDIELEKRMNVVGKSSRANIRIDRETISNFQAKIDYQDAYYIEDMNSTNGTFVNDEMLNYRETRMLNPGDVVRFADVKYRFL